MEIAAEVEDAAEEEVEVVTEEEATDMMDNGRPLKLMATKIVLSMQDLNTSGANAH